MDLIKNTKIPFSIKIDENANGITVTTYTAEELTKLFLAQCYEIGVYAACSKFGLDKSSKVVNDTYLLYVQFLSSPCEHSPYHFFCICFSRQGIIDNLQLLFSQKLQYAISQQLPGGSSYTYKLSEIKERLQYNSCIRVVTSDEFISAEELGCEGLPNASISNLYLDILSGSDIVFVQDFLKKIIASGADSYDNAIRTINVMSCNHEVCTACLLAVLLNVFRVGSTYQSLITEVRKVYDIQ